MARKTEITTVKKAEAISGGDKSYARTATRLMIASAVWELWDKVRKEGGHDQQWLADRLGKDKSRISRLLKGPGNWTIDTVADLLEAMEGRLTVVEAKRYVEISAGSSVEPSLAALRKSPRFWNVLDYQVEASGGMMVLGQTDAGYKFDFEPVEFSPFRPSFTVVEEAA